MLRLGCHESLPKLVAALQVRAFSAETFQFTLSREYSSATQLDEAATGGIRTIGDLPLPRFVPTQRRQRPVPIQLAEAIRQVKASKHAKFDEAIDLAINLGIDPRRGDQMVRGAVSLPHGTGKSVRICVFANDEAAEAARAAGADIISCRNLAKLLEYSDLGGLCQNPKLGTVTTNVTEAVHSLKRGRVEFRADKGAVVHAAVGRCSFDEEQVYANIGALASALLSARPKGVKGSGSGGYLLKASLSSTMGAGVPVSVASLVQAAQVSKHGAGAA
ncbi:hypothetical protein Ndes2437B_g02717 [Nannochloris sp. 'desiccata']